MRRAACGVLITLLVCYLSVRLGREVRAEWRLDASTESLVLEDDPAGIRYDRTRLLFVSDEFVLVGVTRDDLWSDDGVAAVASLQAEFETIEGVESVLSIARLPLGLLRSFEEETAPFVALTKGAQLGDEGVSWDLAREELTGHEMFSGNIVSRDGETAGIVVTLEATEESKAASREWLLALDARARAREALAAARSEAGREAAEEALAAAEARLDAERPEYQAAEDARKDERQRIIEEVHAIVRRADAEGPDDVDVSGVPSLVVLMVEAIGYDVRTFFAWSAGFVLAFLLLVFRRPRWVLIPLLAVGSTLIGSLFILFESGKRITVITANVPSLLLVIGLAHSIHMIVRYRELLVRYPDAPRGERLRRMVRSLVWPCLFTATTTAVGFLSLYFAGSRPIIDFGFLMASGVGLAFVLSFVVVPATLSFLPKSDSGRLERSARALEGLGRLALRSRAAVGLLTLAVAVWGVIGITRLEVEARFIDYFSPESEIHQGLLFIDRNLGGTSGLEVIIRGEPGAFGFSHPENLARAHAVVRWLEDRHEVGAVMSYTGFLEELLKLFLPPEELEDIAPQDWGRASYMLANFLEPAQMQAVLKDYVVVEQVDTGSELVEPFSAIRIVARVHETDEELVRAELLADVQAFLAESFPGGDALEVEVQHGEDGEGGAQDDGDADEEAPAPLDAEVTGMFVLYANMLKSLATSQVTTSALALGVILVMLVILFRSPTAGVLAIIPNLLPIVIVLGAMGWAGIPLDMATVMIASVSLGIGVDCAIHYLFRYREEVERDGDVRAAILRSHGSIGTSILYTSLTSVVGFSVLVFSEFRPNAYFGVLTGVAMVAALFGMLTLLPVLLTVASPWRGAAKG